MIVGSKAAPAGRRLPKRQVMSLRIPRKMPFIIGYATIFAYVLASFPIYAFVDRYNYMVYVRSSDSILASNYHDGLLTLLMNEPLWLLINIFLASFLEPELALQVIIFVPAFLVAFLLMRAEPRYAVLIAVYLLLPHIIKAHTVNLRQGAAIAIFMLGYLSSRTWPRVALMGAAGFVHSSLLIIAPLVLFGNIPHIGTRLSSRVYVLLGVLGAIVAASVLIFAALALGARQGEIYSENIGGEQGLNVIVWAGILALFLLQSSRFIADNFVAILGLIFYLALYFLTPVGGRMLGGIVFLVILSGLSLRGWSFHAFNAWVLLYLVYAYASRPDQVLPGWVM